MWVAGQWWALGWSHSWGGWSRAHLGRWWPCKTPGWVVSPDLQFAVLSGGRFQANWTSQTDDLEMGVPEMVPQVHEGGVETTSGAAVSAGAMSGQKTDFQCLEGRF